MKLPTAADLIDIAEKRQQEQRQEEIHRLHMERIKRDLEIQEIQHSPFDDDMIETVIKRLKQAAQAGESKTIAYRFPSEACSDKGRSINNALRKWENSLVGQPKEFYEFYRRELYPKGYRLRASILNYPGGKLGEVGFTISWEAPITAPFKSSDLFRHGSQERRVR